VILTVDPDTTKSGYAAGDPEHNVFVRAGLATLDEARRIIARHEPSAVVIEIPRVHPTDRIEKVNDLIDVAMVGAEWRCLSRRFCTPKTYESSHWKGQLHKAYAHRHLLYDVLTEPERGALYADIVEHGIRLDVWSYVDAACSALARGRKPKYSSAMTEVLDATCILMHEFGRFRTGWGCRRG